MLPKNMNFEECKNHQGNLDKHNPNVNVYFQMHSNLCWVLIISQILVIRKSVVFNFCRVNRIIFVDVENCVIQWQLIIGMSKANNQVNEVDNIPTNVNNV